MMYISIGTTDHGTFREMELDQFQVESVLESLNMLMTGYPQNADYPQIKRLVEFFEKAKTCVDHEIKELTNRLAQDQIMLRNLTHKPGDDRVDSSPTREW